MLEQKENSLILSVIGFHSYLQKRMSRALSIHGIGVSEYLVLNQLYRAPTQTMRRSDIAEQIGLSPSGITRLINPMEKMGLVKKQENSRDARVSLVALSAAGKQIYEDAQISFTSTSAELFEPLENKQLDVFAELLKIVSRGR